MEPAPSLASGDNNTLSTLKVRVQTTAGSADPEQSLSCAAIGSDCWRISHDPLSQYNSVNLKALLFRFHPASALIYSTDCSDVQVSSSSELPQRRSLIIIHIFSFLCQLRELTPPVFVQALKGAALIIRVRDGTMAFS